MSELFKQLYQEHKPIKSLGKRYKHPVSGFEHGQHACVAIVLKEEGGDGQTCQVFEERMPAVFYAVRVSPGINSVGELKPGYEITTGSGQEMGELAGEIAKAISSGMISFKHDEIQQNCRHGGVFRGEVCGKCNQHVR